MKILYLTHSQEDYLSDSLLLGMREFSGIECIDYPKAEVLYKDHNLENSYSLYGNGFTLYSGVLDDLDIDRFRIQERVIQGEFDIIVFGCIGAQFGLFTQLRPWLNPQNTIVLDGTDSPRPYPAAGFWWRRLYYWGLPRADRKFLYFKREWTNETRFSIFEYFLTKQLLSLIPQPQNLRKIAFSFPAEKIVKTLPEKSKDFTKHIVDDEIVERVQGSATSYVFTCETEYYQDLQSSRFGITVKRSGWDCMRHYEIAANGAVPCFRDLDKKPDTCAPHGLNRTNCITYSSADDLFEKIGSLTEEDYTELQSGAIAWVRQQTTLSRAVEVIGTFKESIET